MTRHRNDAFRKHISVRFEIYLIILFLLFFNIKTSRYRGPKIVRSPRLECAHVFKYIYFFNIFIFIIIYNFFLHNNNKRKDGVRERYIVCRTRAARIFLIIPARITLDHQMA